MTSSFGVVEDKLREAEFFLDRLRNSRYLSFDADCYFSAFVSAARSVTLAIQASLSGIPGFGEWYDGIRDQLKTDPLAPFFVEIRNDVVHKGVSPLNRVSPEHLREVLSKQISAYENPHFLILPTSHNRETTTLVDAVEACGRYFTSLVAVVYDCYHTYKTVVDAKWYFTEASFRAMNRTFEDAIAELGLPPSWAAFAPAGPDAWRAIRMQQPSCLVNDIFEEYLGKTILGPDE